MLLKKSILGDFDMQSPDTSQSGVENYLYRIDKIICCFVCMSFIIMP